jgi:hypoxanthine phosphoribosyltransferase
LQAVDPKELLKKSTLVHSEDQVNAAIDNVVKSIQSRLADEPLVMMCIMTGGMFFCGKLMVKLPNALELDYVQANRYQHDLKGGSLIWTKSPSINLLNKTVIIVDDILDEGVTLKGVKETCLQLGAADVYTAVLTEKDNHLAKSIQADFVGLKVPNAFVFGCGMDAYGWWRNLPEIRALDGV